MHIWGILNNFSICTKLLGFYVMFPHYHYHNIHLDLMEWLQSWTFWNIPLKWLIVGLLKLRIHKSVFGIPGKYLFPDLLNYTKNTKKTSGIIICYVYILFSLTECPKNPFGHSVSLTVLQVCAEVWGQFIHVFDENC